ncbi:Uncharacterized protein GBIM_15446, partial [Gryllus bimaculatus]
MSPHMQGPVFLQEPPPWLEFSNSTGSMLSCSAHGSPPPDIRWLDASDKELAHIPRLSNDGHNQSPDSLLSQFRADFENNFKIFIFIRMRYLIDAGRIFYNYHVITSYSSFKRKLVLIQRIYESEFPRNLSGNNVVAPEHM